MISCRMGSRSYCVWRSWSHSSPRAHLCVTPTTTVNERKSALVFRSTNASHQWIGSPKVIQSPYDFAKVDARTCYERRARRFSKGKSSFELHVTSLWKDELDSERATRPKKFPASWAFSWFHQVWLNYLQSVLRSDHYERSSCCWRRFQECQTHD